MKATTCLVIGGLSLLVAPAALAQNWTTNSTYTSSGGYTFNNPISS